MLQVGSRTTSATRFFGNSNQAALTTFKELRRARCADLRQNLVAQRARLKCAMFAQLGPPFSPARCASIRGVTRALSRRARNRKWLKKGGRGTGDGGRQRSEVGSIPL